MSWLILLGVIAVLNLNGIARAHTATSNAYIKNNTPKPPPWTPEQKWMLFKFIFGVIAVFGLIITYGIIVGP